MVLDKELTGEQKEDWNRFVIKQNGCFLQSWERGEFQKFVGREVNFLKNENLQALVVKHNLPFGKSYLYCPRGPVINLNLKSQNSKPQLKTQNFLDETKKISKESDAIFIRIEPTFDISEDDLKELGFIKTKNVQPSKTLVLDLSLSEEELLTQIHEKTRYNIGLAKRRGVIVRKTDYNEKDFEIFWKLLNLTAKRQGIRIFPKEYYSKQLTINSKQFYNLLFIAEYQDKPIAANLVNFFGQTATYLHGGWDKYHRSLMAPHLLQWEQIKEARNRGCELYDFWGIDEQKWPGVTRFKKGFGGKEVNYIGTWDLVLQPMWYKMYSLARKVL